MSTTTPLGPDFVNEMMGVMIRGLDDGALWAVRMLWDILIEFLAAHWLAVFVILLLLFVLAIGKMMMGKWGMFGSLLYNFLYFGTLFVIGRIFGPEVFVNDIFNAACAILLYPLCYWIVGLVLDETGFKNRRF